MTSMGLDQVFWAPKWIKLGHRRGMGILKQVLTQLLLYYTRLQKAALVMSFHHAWSGCGL